MKKSELKELINECILEEMDSEEFSYTTAMLGGSIGTKNVRTKGDLKGLTPMDHSSTMGKEGAQRDAKRMNKGLSPGEKKYYGIRYVVAQVKNGKFTGK